MAEPNFSDVFEENTSAADLFDEEGEAVAGSEAKEGQDDAVVDSGRLATEDLERAKDSGEAEREAETEALRREARISAEKEMDELFRDVGMVNPYTNEVIRSKADFLAWKKRYQQDCAASSAEVQRLSSESQKGGMDTGEHVRQTVERELEKIRQWDDEIKSLEDIADSEQFAAIYDRVMRGYDLSDAVYLANAASYQRRAADRAEQAAINRLRSKEHLVGVHTRGGGETVVPRDVMAEFKRLMPKASGEEIRKFYRKDQAHLKK